MVRISAVVIAENEEHVIEACLKSLAFCDELILVDGGSTDRTVEIAQRLGARVIHHPSGTHGIHYNKNLGAREANGDWILSIDADEQVSPELAAELREMIRKNLPCYRVARRTYFLGKWIKHCGWWPGYVVRLWKKGHTEWPPEVHQVPDPHGECGTLENPLDHYSYVDIEDWGRKVLHFSGCEAVEAQNRGEKIGRGALVYALSVRPAFIFLQKLVVMSAWKDGMHGLVISGSAAFASWLRAVRRWEMDVTGKKPQLGGRSRREGGFTLAEILIVVVIIGILAAFVLPNFFGKTEETRIVAAQSQIAAIETALRTYNIDHGKLPTMDEGLAALNEEKNGKPPAMEKAIPKDPWGNDYRYLVPGEKNRNFDLWSTGPDGTSGTEDDVGNW